jgi:hypothetical protein
MSNQLKLLISTLFIVVIILCICLTRFYYDVTKNTDNVSDDGKVADIVRIYGDMQIFRSVNGCYGVLDADNTVVIEPEWLEILYVTTETVIVSQRMENEVLIGGIDYEENVVLPFVFRSMERLNTQYYVGTVADDEKCILYDADFEPVFQRSWDAAEYENGILILETDGCQFSYYIADGQPVLHRGELQCTIGNLPLNWKISNQVYLSDLTAEDLLRINTCVSQYMDMLTVLNDFSGLADISSVEYTGSLTKPGSFQNLVLDEISDFSFSLSENEKEKGGYDFIFTVSCHEESAEVSGEDGGYRNALMHLHFLRNSENEMILTSADINFQSVEVPVTESATADDE